ncbi:LacI family DNA-binding transcriptional regulator [Peribacillus sp. FSL H8-0477]|uniref:LacI family DNA-binding transcriptional regulator n=1 Tax=Peribacillus sp. FSL H8-0477 TaxID=2921388 RepID=UPI0030F5F627
MKVKIKDIANACGVSAGTVDRALNNRLGISEETKKKILKVAEEMNYQPDYTARGLVMGKTNTIGVVLFDLYNQSFAQLLNAIEVKARKLGYFVYITLSDKNKKDEIDCIEHLVNRKVDGIILLTVNKGEQFESYLSTLTIPIITILNFVSDKWEFIGVRERQAMREATEYIVRQNHYQTFIYISPPLTYLGQTNIYTQEERLAGFLEGLKNNKITTKPYIVKNRDYLNELEEIIFSHEKAAIICSTDLYALEVMNFLKKQGVRIPEDVGVMGFDDIEMLKYVSPRLTTVKYPINELGTKAIESIINRIEHREFIPTPLLDYEMIKGDSI